MSKVEEQSPGLLEKVAEFYYKTLTDTPDAFEFLDNHRLVFSSGKLCQILPHDIPMQRKISALGLVDDCKATLKEAR